MMINQNKFKKSESFKNVEKDLSYIVSKIIEDEELLKLLSLKESEIGNLTQEEKKGIIKDCIRIIPLITDIEETKPWAYITVQFTDFMQNGTNTEHRDKFLIFNIICHMDTWNMNDFKLRPYQIAGRLDVLFDKKALAGTYTINFLSAENLILSEKIGGVAMAYLVTYSNASDRHDG